MGKRRREAEESGGQTKARKAPRPDDLPSAQKDTHLPVFDTSDQPVTIQIITGSYDRVLHGFVATIPAADNASSNTKSPVEASKITFADNFLFNAHSSSIRSLAVSPPNEATSDKRILATGASDERINLYQLSCVAPVDTAATQPGTSHLPQVATYTRNKELGSLLHHSRTVTRLAFPTRGKLFSAADDNTIAITRVRDWTMLSSIKAPLPKAIGRPSGDTAAPGEVPAGINDFAFHPSMKLMISVGKGERCMRLWNLVTGKKAGVLSFERDVLAQIGEGRYSTGEGRRVLWSADGERFVVVFERGAVVYDMDSKPIAIVTPHPSTKVHEVRFVPSESGVLALSTEDGRILFHDTSLPANSAPAIAPQIKDAGSKRLLRLRCIGQIDTASTSPSGRIKDFELLPLARQSRLGGQRVLCVAATSGGTVSVWMINNEELQPGRVLEVQDDRATAETSAQIGTLLGLKESGNRLTCLTAFVMDEQRSNEADVDGPEPDAELSNDGDSDMS